MGTLDDLVAVFADLVEVQAPAIKDLPAGVDSAAWIKAQGIVHGRADLHGRIIGFKPEGMPGVLALAKAFRSANPAYARGTQLRSFLKMLISQLVTLKRAGQVAPSSSKMSTAWRALSPRGSPRPLFHVSI